MAYVKSKSLVAYVTEETTAGTAVDPTLGSQAFALNEGLEMNLARETVDRAVLRSSIAKEIPLNGMRSVAGSVSLEAKSHGTAGTAPEYDLFMHSCLAGKRTIATTTTSKATGNTANSLAIEDADITKFNVGDIILVKQTGDYWVSPIISKTAGAGTASITLLRTRGSAFANSVVIEKVCMYYGVNSGHKSITITAFYEDAVKKQASGVLVSSLALENFSVGQIPNWNIGFEGFNLVESLAASGLTSSYNSAKPPVCLNACVFVDGVAIPVPELSISIENTIAKVTSTCSPNGVIDARVSERGVSGSFTTYSDTTSIANYTKFSTGTEFSLAFYMGVPTATAGEYEDLVAVFIPRCIITEKPHSDQDGVIVEQISFSAGYSDTYSSDIFIGLI